jgi:hypothetical protein
MLLVVMLVGTLATLFVFGIVDTTALVLRRDRDTAAAFAEVKRALIGWSAARTEGAGCPPSSCARPGELPCPDINPLDGYEDGSCVAGAIGRVPWKTLGIPEPKDAAGETLWYAIAGPFRTYNVNSNPIHSDTKGNITVYQDTTASAITAEAIAVLFAPGATLGAQNRDTVATALCPTTGTTIARNLCAANYLESTASVDNSVINGPFISAQSSDTFNDKVLAITTADLMPIVEQRVAREVRTILENYRIATAAQGYNSSGSPPGIYPWADCSDGTSDYPTPDPPNPPSADGSNKGRIPFGTAYPVDWGTGTPPTPTLPNWFKDTNPDVPPGTPRYNWAWVIFYAVGKNFLEGGGTYCGSCEAGQTLLSSDNGANYNKRALIIMTGPAGANRPSPDGVYSGLCPQSQWATYVDDGVNNDLADDLFVTPSSTAYARDRIYTIP